MAKCRRMNTAVCYTAEITPEFSPGPLNLTPSPLVTFQVMYGALVACLVLRAVFIVTWWVCRETFF